MQVSEIETEGSICSLARSEKKCRKPARSQALVYKGRMTNRIQAFVSFDGAGLDRITNGALGSRRYRVEFRGAGGHSWSDFVCRTRFMHWPARLLGSRLIPRPRILEQIQMLAASKVARALMRFLARLPWM